MKKTYQATLTVHLRLSVDTKSHKEANAVLRSLVPTAVEYATGARSLEPRIARLGSRGILAVHPAG